MDGPPTLVGWLLVVLGAATALVACLVRSCGGPPQLAAGCRVSIAIGMFVMLLSM